MYVWFYFIELHQKKKKNTDLVLFCANKLISTYKTFIKTRGKYKHNRTL